ncbi:MAG: hypothetical protein LBO73_04885 [Holosporaceae bacterium]|jgi:hypothetical protein|nr:hypothetical protein [Holosporaceae bacterium]
MSIEKIILDSVKSAKDEVIEGVLGALKSDRGRGPGSKSPERIILDSVKSAKDEIIEGVLGALKSDKSSAGAKSSEKTIPNPPQSNEDDVLISSTSDNAGPTETPSAARSARDPEAAGIKKEPGSVHSNPVGKISLINACGRNKRLNIMVIGAALGLIFCLLMLISYKGDLPGEVVGIVSTISGIFGACLKDAYSFEFGSSRGSKEKDEKISSTILERLKY